MGGLTVVNAQQRVSVTRNVEAAVARVSLLNEVVQSTTSETEVDIASGLTSHGLGDVAAGEALSSASPAAVKVARQHTDALLDQLAASTPTTVLATQLRGRLHAARALDPAPPIGGIDQLLTWTGKRSTSTKSTHSTWPTTATRIMAETLPRVAGTG